MILFWKRDHFSRIMYRCWETWKVVASDCVAETWGLLEVYTTRNIFSTIEEDVTFDGGTGRFRLICLLPFLVIALPFSIARGIVRDRVTKNKNHSSRIENRNRSRNFQKSSAQQFVTSNERRTFLWIKRLAFVIGVKKKITRSIVKDRNDYRSNTLSEISKFAKIFTFLTLG